MATDYPDYTSLMQIIGSDIMVPIDVQGAYIMMPVDIQAQYLTLEIDIVAQSLTALNIDITAQTIGNIAVNIAASAITLNVAIASSAVTFNVDITTQTLTTLKIDIKTQSLGLYLQPEWAALQGMDVNVTGGTAGYSPGVEYVTVSYAVPAGKTLFISHWGAATITQACNIMGRLYNATTATYLATSGGAQGFAVVLNKPIKLTTGQTLYLYVAHLGTGTSTLLAHFGGYLV